MTRSISLLILGHLISTVILTFAFKFAFSLFLFVAMLFGDETQMNAIIYGVPQLILLPIFFGLYIRDKKQMGN